jgi:hypothetical protein
MAQAFKGVIIFGEDGISIPIKVAPSIGYLDAANVFISPEDANAR